MSFVLRNAHSGTRIRRSLSGASSAPVRLYFLLSSDEVPMTDKFPAASRFTAA